MKLHIKIEKGNLITTLHQQNYLEKYEGKMFVGEVDERSSDSKVKFIEGAIVPYFFYQHLKGVYKDFKDARTGLKWACNWTKSVVDDKGNSREETKSMADIYSSSKRTQWFIDSSERYFMDNGYLFPDSEHYTKWSESGVLVGEIYPPLQELIDKYNNNDKN